MVSCCAKRRYRHGYNQRTVFCKSDSVYSGYSYISACCRPKYADSGEEDTAATTTEAVYGDKNVYEIQQWLNSHFGFDIYIDGVYGPQTRAALVMALQTVLNCDFGADLDVDGIYGRLTRKAVVNLERGAYGDYVKVLHGFLICMGYDTGGFDGDFGGRTEESVKTFQTVRDLYVDGIAGKNTFEELAKG
nr:peptidoglycan-binding domain-containing protein [uncultured Ruminococcus sp.]